MPYAKQVERLADVLDRPPHGGANALIVDVPAVGRSVAEQLAGALVELGLSTRVIFASYSSGEAIAWDRAHHSVSVGNLALVARL